MAHGKNKSFDIIIRILNWFLRIPSFLPAGIKSKFQRDKLIGQ